MKTFFKQVMLFSFLLGPALVFANPVVSNNVHVIQNATAAQCQASWRGNAATETNVVVSGYGQNNGMAAPAVQSCTGCALDPKTSDCVCATCYSYSN